MVLWRDDENITLTHVDVAQSDILIVQCKIQRTSFTYVRVCMLVNDYNQQSNLVECGNHIIVGDFNEQTVFLGPHTLNKNSEGMLNLIDH